MGGKTVRARGPESLLGDSVFAIRQGSCTHEISTIKLPKKVLYNSNTSWHAILVTSLFICQDNMTKATYRLLGD